MIGVLECNIGADLTEQFEGACDVNLGLVFEESFVAGLAKTRCGVDDCLSERVVRDSAVGREIVCVRRLPVCGGTIGPDLEQNQIAFAAEVKGHFAKRFPVKTFVVDADATPARLVFEDLIE
ncbi:MAG: hypothetical protein JWL59_4837 [Chthoniobacteraceae bacterium]|nr:hypothetical protein [Chthoniobacteraceae bacterium]